MKILLLANTDWYLYNFRLGLAKSLRELGHEVVLVSPPGRYGTRLESLGFRWIAIPFDAGSMSPLANLRLAREIFRLYRRERPDVAHHFTIKCVMFGGLAARALRIPCVNAITGLGHLFTDRKLKTRCVRKCVMPLYRFVVRGPRAHAIFQNEEDQQAFIRMKIARADRTTLIRGSGVDCDRFRPTTAPRSTGPCRILFASRLLREKGVFELVEAAEQLAGDKIPFELSMAGEPYPGNPSSLSKMDLERLEATGHAKFLGHVDDVPGLLRDADIVVLPSYQEGTPRVLLEAAAAGKPLVGTDIAGCRGVVQHGVNGELVPPRTVNELAAALKKLVGDADLRERYGRRSRQIVLDGFSEQSVVERTLGVYQTLLGDQRALRPELVTFVQPADTMREPASSGQLSL